MIFVLVIITLIGNFYQHLRNFTSPCDLSRELVALEIANFSYLCQIEWKPDISTDQIGHSAVHRPKNFVLSRYLVHYRFVNFQIGKFTGSSVE